MTAHFLAAAVVSALVMGAPVPAEARQGATRDTPLRSTPAGSATISGIVILEGASPSRPIRRAIVTLTGTGIATSRQIATDDEGRFAFGGLAGGRFSLAAEKPAYVKTYYGSTRPGRPPGTSIAVADGQQVRDVAISIVKGASISGRMLEESGAPVVAGQVTVELVTHVNGQRKLVRPYAGANLVVTDDRGVYRAYGLPPGEYIVRATGGGAFFGTLRLTTAAEMDAATREIATGGAKPPTPAPVAPTAAPQLARSMSYHPGVPEMASAQTVTVGVGEDRGGIDVVSRMVRVSRASGMALSPTGQPAQNMSVGIANLSTGSIYSSMGAVRADANGRFAVGGLAPGRWLLFGRAAEPNTPSDGQYPWWASTEFVIGEQDVTDLVLSFTEGSTITGRVTFKGNGTPPDPTRLRVSIASLPAVPETGPFPISATPAADGTFVLRAVPAGKYRITMAAAAGWVLQAATSGATEVLDTPLEVGPGQDAALTLTMTDRVTEITGTLLDQLGRPAPEYSVVVFSADRAHWGTAPRRISGLVKLATDGGYRVAGLPPGDYVLCVVTDVDASQLNDPSMLEQLMPAGVKLTLAEGEKKRQDFKIGR
ncbi:MAG TPA: carboxypeptidase-like regulatory domain-containing protein [Vicinamibacterales bacterium]|nr:carboxypeptidase-like regulatory domain-containing protein [Vicinamibacterales bacterium]